MGEEDQDLLKTQYYIMVSYDGVLSTRIGRFKSRS